MNADDSGWSTGGDGTVTVTVERVTYEELTRRRGDILTSLGMTREEIAALAADYALTPEELAAWEKLRSIEFLLEDA